MPDTRVRIDELNPQLLPSLDHVVAAMKDGSTFKFSFQQVADLILAVVRDGAPEALDTLAELATLAESLQSDLSDLGNSVDLRLLIDGSNIGEGSDAFLAALGFHAFVIGLKGVASAPSFRSNIGAELEPGLVAWFGSSSPPSGWIKANGATISRTTYANLFSAIGTTFGVGDGSTTFKIPDLRGEFVRGWDDARGVDAGRSMGSFQSGIVGPHSHYLRGGNAAISDYFGGSSADYGVGIGSVDVSHATGSYGPDTGSETRPRNVAMLACIKY